MLECGVELLQIAMRVAEIVFDIGIIGLSHSTPSEIALPPPPVLVLDRLLARGIVGVARNEV
jgi:hypothetical protein